MGNPAVNLIGRRFGFLVVTKRAGKNAGGCALWGCLCDCGNTVVRQSQYLRNAQRLHPRSCGCWHGNIMHGMTNSRPFRIWSGMQDRCLNKSSKDFANYGGRGITVCAAWRKSFQTFWRDMQPTYQDLLSLDRVDNNGPYNKANCRWATQTQQHNNRRGNVFIQTPEGRVTLSQAAKTRGMQPQTLCARLNRYGWTLDKALSTPVRKKSLT